ncbi:hypothetical protein C0J52_17319 [Blattella germanica]|nr:hypothetical protein C0J52_17319 [Blattella germanica]
MNRWRRRWFVLRHSGELPGQFFLEYYTDRNCRKLKGKIDLDQCEQVDADYDYGPTVEEEEPATTGETITNEQQEHILDPLTESPPVSPTSTISGPYIPISECISGKSLSSPNGLEDFNNIVRQGGYGIIATAQYGLTNNKGLTSSWHKNSLYGLENRNQGLTRLGASGETTALLTGKTPALPLKRPLKPCDNLESAGFYDSPRKLHPPNLELRQGSGTPPLQSPTTDGESVFTDEECPVPIHRPPSVNWETFPNADGENVRQKRPSDSSVEVDMGSAADIGSWSVVKRFGKLTVVDNVGSVPRDGPIGVHGRQLSLPTNLQHPPVAPPRPPKPFHLLLETPSHNYLNLENVSPLPRNRRNVRKQSVTSLSSDTSKKTGVPASPNDCISASDGNEEPPSPLSPVQNNGSVVIGVNDEMYDFPRSHQYPNNPSSPSALSNVDSKVQQASRHCYTNAAPSKVNGEVFRYDFHTTDSPLIAHPEGASNAEEPISPHSDGSSSLASNSTTAIYSNLPSPLTAQGVQSGTDSGQFVVPPPPAVNRGLKPGRKLSDSTSVVSNEPSPVSPAALAVSGHYPPSVDRKLKPHLKQPEQEPLSLAAPPACRPGSENNRSLRKNRAAPSPTPPASTPSTLHVVSATRFEEIQYLDLDLDCDAANGGASASPKSPERSQPTSTVYKTVDFVKTEAFNRTRQEVEKDRKQCTAAEQ